MAKYDVIINAFSCSEQAPCGKWAKEFFTNPPLIINVPGTGSASFRAKAAQWAKTGDLFKAAVAERAPEMNGCEIGKRAMTTFSCGWNFADQVFMYDNEIEKLDAYLLLDGMHSTNQTNWIKFAKRAATGKAFFAMAHSSIVPPFISSTVSNNTIFAEAGKTDGVCANMEIPDYILNAVLLAPITISLAASKDANGKILLPAIKKTWTQDPLKTHESCGNMAILGYNGNDRPDHVYIAWYVSPRLWQWLGGVMSEVVRDEPKIEIKPMEPTPPSIPVDVPPLSSSSSATSSISVWDLISSVIKKIFGA